MEAIIAPNEKYEKFFAKFSEIETIKIADWKPYHILSYFCFLYEKEYGKKYQWKFNSPSPSKCFEIFHINKVRIQLSSSPIILKDYIDWIFANKVPLCKRRFTSISFMTNEDFVREYKIQYLTGTTAPIEEETIRRSTKLPESYRAVFIDVGQNVATYGDLAFLSKMNNKEESINRAFDKIIELGFDEEILRRII